MMQIPQFNSHPTIWRFSAKNVANQATVIVVKNQLFSNIVEPDIPPTFDKSILQLMLVPCSFRYNLFPFLQIMFLLENWMRNNLFTSLFKDKINMSKSLEICHLLYITVFIEHRTTVRSTVRTTVRAFRNIRLCGLFVNF